MNPDHQKNHIIGADILRGVAILIVLIYHTTGFISAPLVRWHRDFHFPVMLTWNYPLSLGWAGVPLFFVLSGFCIHLSFLRDGEFDVRRFFWRRFWRIYPAYFFALVTFAAIGGMDIFAHQDGRQFLLHAFFVHNFDKASFRAINPSFWSIAVEMQLYLLYPLLLLFRSRLGMAHSLLPVFIVGCLWRTFGVCYWGLPTHPISFAFSTPLATWFDWALGAYVAERFTRGEPAFTRRGSWISLLTLFLIGARIWQPLLIFNFLFASAISAVVLDAAVHRSWKKNPAWEFLTFTGLISYSLYLWHQPLLSVAVWAAARLHSATAGWVFCFVFIFLVAWISYHLLEKTGIRIGDQLWKRPARKAPAPAVPDGALVADSVKIAKDPMP